MNANFHKIMSDNLNYKFTLLDKVGIMHYLVSGSKIESYKIAKDKVGQRNNDSMNTMAGNYFKSQRILALITLTKNELINGINGYHDRIGLKDTTNSQTDNNNELNINNINEVAEIDKASAIQMIEKVLNNNRTDLKTIKELTPQLIKLKDWDKERINDKTNITTFQLPRY